jgi:retron-type reverse transcriptase
MVPVADWQNLRHAVGKAARGKHHQAEVRGFLANLHEQLSRLQEELLAGTYRVGGYRRFLVHDPKRRTIHAAPFRDRVLQHALLNVVEPDFERVLISDCFASRKGKGKHAAWKRALQFSRRFPFYVKLDVRKYFDSIDHARLLSLLRRMFKDPELLRLLEQIIESYHTAPGRGVPIGTLISQHCANHYLGGVDRLVKERLRVRGYVRYMDDSALWSEDKACLRRWVAVIRTFLWEDLHLRLKPCRFGRTCEGVPFLGARVLSAGILPDRRARRRFADRLQGYAGDYRAGRMTERDLQRRTDALLGSIPSSPSSPSSPSAAWRTRAIAAVAELLE